jgi:hypothetical protein
VSRRKVKETDRFTAVSDSGASVTVVETTTFIEAASFEGSAWVEGPKRYGIARGESLNCTAPGTFETLTGVTYRRVKDRDEHL